MPDVIDAVEEGFRALARDDVRVPERLFLDVPEFEGALLEMPAYARSLRAPASSELSHGRGALGIKVVSVFRKNA